MPKTKKRDPFRGKFTPLSAIPDTTIVPNKKGTDLYTKDDSYDAHIRLEKLNGELQMIIDVFDSKIEDPSAAYVESRNFLNNEEGSTEAMEFLRKFGLSYKIIPAC